MKAIVYHNYGSPDVLKREEVEKPMVEDKQVLIKVYAASLNALDSHLRTADIFLVCLGGGLLKPKDQRLGVDLAGRVEAVGRNVTQFKAGDEVFGTGVGALAEYACAREDAVVLKPPTVTFEAAATVPIAALTALQGLRDHGQIQPGQKVLIQGCVRRCGHLCGPGWRFQRFFFAAELKHTHKAGSSRGMTPSAPLSARSRNAYARSNFELTGLHQCLEDAATDESL